MRRATSTTSPDRGDSRIHQLASALTATDQDQRAQALAAAAHHLLTNRYALSSALGQLGPHPTAAQIEELLTTASCTEIAARGEETNR